MLYHEPEFKPNPRSKAFQEGFQAAMKDFHQSEDPEFVNPYVKGTDQWKGYEEGVYTFTQK